MSIFLLMVFALVALVAWVVLRDQVKQLRFDIAVLIKRTDERLRLAETRMTSLEIALTEQRSAAATAAATPTVQAIPTEPIVEAQPAAAVHSAVTDVAAFVAPAEIPPDLPFEAFGTGAPAGKGDAWPVAIASVPSILHETYQAARPPASTFEMKPLAATNTERDGHVLSLEERLGGNWLNKLGVALLVIGLAFFLALRLNTMGPGGKVLTGFVIGFAMLAGGVWLERAKEAYRLFARAGIGGGWALIFFTTYAMHHLAAARVIDSVVVDLSLMLLVAAGMVAHSLRYKSQTVTGLAFGLAFATVATSHLESGGGAVTGTVIFSLWASALLAVGLVVVTTKRHWAWLELAGLVAVYANHFLWLSLVMVPMSRDGRFAMFWPSTVLILFYWAIFRTAYLLRKPLDGEEDRISSLSAVLNASGVLGLLKYQSAHPEWTFWALLAMGLVELSLGLWARRRRRSAFVVLTTLATVLLVAAVPYKFHGVSWPVLWLVEAHVLALCGLRLGEPVFRRLGLLAGFAAGTVLAVQDLAPEIVQTGRTHPTSAAIGLALAAALYWVHSEVYPRRWSECFANEYEAVGLKITSWLGLAAAGSALWLQLPERWVAVGWLGLVLVLGLMADWKRATNLAVQADALALGGIAGLIGWDFMAAPNGVFKVPAALGIGLLFGGMRRQLVPEGLPKYVAPGYSWAASLLSMLWIGMALDEKWLVLGWVGLALVLFEAGRHFSKGFLRWQGFVSALLACGMLQVHWTEHIFTLTGEHGWLSVGWADVVALLSTVALLYWFQEGTRPTATDATDIVATATRSELRLGLVAGLFGTLIAAAWLPMLVPSWGRAESATMVDAVWAVVLLGVALGARRGAFQVHGILIALGVGLYGIGLMATGGQPEAGLPWFEANLLRMGLAAAVLLSGLAFAYPLRKLAGWNVWPEVARRPEQWFFFVAYGLMIVTLAVELRSGMWTLGWSLLGVGAFVFALLVGERSFRLGGLALLLVSVVKVLLMDVWALTPADRYTSLIGMGCALLLVSFLYTRFRAVFRRYL